MGSFAVPDVNELKEKLGVEAPSGALPPGLLQALVKQIQQQFPYLDVVYIEKVVIAAMLTALGISERLYLPMLDPANLSKQDALPYLFWGLLYDGWAPDPASGTTVFVTGYDKRSKPSSSDPTPVANLRKRIYASATTPDLMPIYSEKIVPFFQSLLAPANAGQPLMQKYLDSYFKTLYWDLHLGVTGSDVPDFAIEIGQAFNTVLAYVTPTMELVYDAYMKVRELRPQLTAWIQQQVARIAKNGDPTTIVHYWLRNSDNGQDPNFLTADILFEAFHDFVALSQWGNTLYHVMALLSPEGGDPVVQQALAEAWADQEAKVPSSPWLPFDRYLMELFRVISPNGASISTFGMPPVTNSPFEQYTYLFTSHLQTSGWEVHWSDPDKFNPGRYINCPTAGQNDPARSKEIGFAQCPFDPEAFAVKDGRDVDLANSIFGTVYPTVKGVEAPICDYAGYAPFGFGYRRCPGELLNLQVMRDLFHVYFAGQLKFTKLDIKNPNMVPVGPLTVVPDIYGFTTPS